MQFVDLSLVERVTLESLLVTKGSISDMVTRREILSKVSISDEEKLKIGYVEIPLQNGMVHRGWKPEFSDNVKAVEFSRPEIMFIQECVSLLDSQKNIPDSSLDVALKFKDLSVEKE